MDLWELCDEYALFARAANRSANTIESQRYHLRRFVKFLEKHGIAPDSDTITPRVIREFIAESNDRYAVKTVSNNVRALKTLFAFGVREELIDRDPTRIVATPKVPTTDFDIFEPSDLDTLLRACDRGTIIGLRDFAIIMVLFDCGLRATELVNLRLEDVDWQRGLLSVFGKGSKSRTVPVSARTLRAVRKYLNKRRTTHNDTSDTLFANQECVALTRWGLAQALRRIGKTAGLKVYPHKFRHSFAVNALRNDAREFDIQACLGHTTLMMTRHYARQSGEDLAKQHKRFSPADRLSVRV